MIKDKVEPYPSHLSPYRSYEVQETKSTSQQASPIPTTADDTAIPITTLPTLIPFPRMPTPPIPTMSPVPVERIATSSVPIQDIESAFVVDFDKVRRGLIYHFHAYSLKLKSFFFPVYRSIDSY